MPLAKEVAQELRKLADALDREPEQELFVPEISFSCKYKYPSMGLIAKDVFLALARILPRPLAKGTQSFDDDAMELRYSSDALIITTAIERSKVCRIIERERTIPAVYECEPLLSEAEDATLTEAV
jgi:hypothetical protein